MTASSEYSRYRYCSILDWGNLGGVAGVKLLDEREPFRFRDEPDNRFHSAVEGDTWWGLAWRYFPSFPNKSLLWFLLCEFQPEPVVDPTIVIAKGTQIVIPSERLVRTQAFNREQRRFH